VLADRLAWGFVPIEFRPDMFTCALVIALLAEAIHHRETRAVATGAPAVEPTRHRPAGSPL
jgi:hypothetical protein